MKRKLFPYIPFSLCFFLAVTLPAREWLVTPGDSSFEEAQSGWQAGDTITFAPGEYHASFRSTTGGLTLRAAIPGTVILRGDRDAPPFVPHAPGIWKCPWPAMPQAINERDSFLIYQYVPNLIHLSRTLATWTYDELSSTLYVSTSDGQAPERHYLTISVIDASGLYFESAEKGGTISDLVVEGLVFSGFYSRKSLSFVFYNTHWGLFIKSAKDNVLLRNNTAFLNGYGIGIGRGCENSAIEDCHAFGNKNPFNASGGGITIFAGATNSCISRCSGADNRWNDVCVYAGFFTNFIFAENRCYGSLRTKANGWAPNAYVDRCIARAASHIRGPGTMKNTVVLNPMPFPEDYTNINILAAQDTDIDLDRDFADPVNFDYRPQSTAAENIKQRAPAPESTRLLFVKKGAATGGDGRSVANALDNLEQGLERLKEGGDLYIVNEQDGDIVLRERNELAIRGRGLYPVKLNGGIRLENCSNITLERLEISGEISIINSGDITINQCLAAGVNAENSAGLRLVHSVAGKTGIKDCDGAFVTANVFTDSMELDKGWSDYNAYPSTVPENEEHSFVASPVMGANGTFENGWLFEGRAINGFPVGPWRRQARSTELVIRKADVNALSSESASIEVSANLPFSGVLYYGSDANCSETMVLSSLESTHHVGLKDLEPGQKYFYRVAIRGNAREHFSNQSISRQITERRASSGVSSFTTATDYAEPRILHVSTEGDDSGDGSPAKPLRHIGQAAGLARPGDTVLIAGGEYAEEVLVPVSGTRERPITFMGAEGELVCLLGGDGRVVMRGIVVNSQHNLVFDNLLVNGMRSRDGLQSNGLLINDSSNIRLKRIFSYGITWSIRADKTSDLTIENCAKLHGHEAWTFFNCENLQIRNCTFAIGGVSSVTIKNFGDEKAVFENNIVTDQITMKGANPVLYVHNFDVVTERNNCYYMRTPESEKPVFGYNICNGVESENRLQYLGRERVTYAEYLGRFKRERTSFFANPALRSMPEFQATYSSLEEQKETWRQSSTNQEVQHRGKLRITDFITTNPEVLERGCGLQPQAFEKHLLNKEE